MRSSITCIFLFLLCRNLPAQEINIGFNSTASGRNLTGQHEMTKGKNEFSFGIGVNLNNFRQIEMHDDLYKKKLFTTKAHHRINLNFTYQRYVLADKVKCLEPFLFYDLQAKRATAAYLSVKIEYDSTYVRNWPGQGVIGYDVLDYFGPFFWLENNVGIGFKAMITDKLFIKQRFGVGVNFILGHDDQLTYRRFSWFDWEFSTLLHFSIGYKLNGNKSE